MLCQKIIPKIKMKKVFKFTIKAIKIILEFSSSTLLVASTYSIVESKLLQLIESVKSFSPNWRNWVIQELVFSEIFR